MAADEVDRIGHARWPGALIVGVLAVLVCTAGIATVRSAVAAGSRLAGTRTAEHAATVVVEVGAGARPVDAPTAGTDAGTGGEEGDGDVVRVGTTELGPVHAGLAFSLADVPPGAQVKGAQLRLRRAAPAVDARVYNVFNVDGDLAGALGTSRPAAEQAVAAIVVEPDADDEWVAFEVTGDVKAALEAGAVVLQWLVVDLGAGVGPAQVALFDAHDEVPELLITYVS